MTTASCWRSGLAGRHCANFFFFFLGGGIQRHRDLSQEDLDRINQFATIFFSFSFRYIVHSRTIFFSIIVLRWDLRDSLRKEKHNPPAQASPRRLSGVAKTHSHPPPTPPEGERNLGKKQEEFRINCYLVGDAGLSIARSPPLCLFNDRGIWLIACVNMSKVNLDINNGIYGTLHQLIAFQQIF